MTSLGWVFLIGVWATIGGLTAWCFRMVLSPTAKPHETDLPPSGRM